MYAYYADQFVLPLPPNHRFPMAKYRLLRDRIAHELPEVQLLPAPAASQGELALAHHPGYVADVCSGNLPSGAQRAIGFPWSPEMVERSLRSVGATIAACRSALRHGVAANLAGGTHHAHADRGAGYCVFNDTAVASRLMQAEWRREGHLALTERARPQRGDLPHHLQVAVIDLDVHQGDGTARIFEGDRSVFTLSLHGRSNYPFTKAHSDLDLDLPDGCGDAEYLAVLEQALEQLDHRFVPGLVIYLAGADPYAGDRLGRLALSAEGLHARDRQVFRWCFERAIPVAMTMAGGYADPIDTTVQIQLNSFQVALEFAGHWRQAAEAR